jgi:hypothetical protein
MVRLLFGKSFARSQRMSAMRQGLALVLGAAVALLAGCTGHLPIAPRSWAERLRPFQAPPGTDVVQMDVALIERPVGDPVLNQELWQLADEQALGLECKERLENNGLRVGQIAGITPACLQDLLASERSNPKPRRIQVLAGKAPQPLSLGPPLAECRFQLRQDGAPQAVVLEQACCQLEVVPSLAGNGRTCLRFTPQVQHGKAAGLPRPSADRSHFEVQQAPVEAYGPLAWEVSLAPNEYVVIGGRLDRPETLGCRFFVRPEESPPVQRLLVIRTGRSRPGLTPDDEPAGEVPPPLALQAALSSARSKTN